ncbi:hypothetical protein DL768_002309 [Monosporascus sp. mg162]|nr:hypothetical protein DL768_002309 [Monosporascus sp. mg162]
MTGLNRATNLSLSESYQECIDLFGRFVLALCEEGCGVISLKQVRFPDILEEYGRTQIWGDQTKAVLPARARGSLDDTLRHDDELKYLVEDILARLSALLRQATSIARKKYGPVVGSEHDSISSAGTDSDFSSDDIGECQSRRAPKICLLVQQIFEQIRSLFDLSSLLRRPNIADEYISSIPSKSDSAALGDSDTLPLSVGFSSSDENHVLEKVLQWRGLTKSSRSFEFEDENVAAIGKAPTSARIEDTLWFCQRLARANTRRREQLQYWIDHPCDSKQDATNVTQRETLNPAQIPVSHQGPKSALSKQSFSTAAISAFLDTRMDVRPRAVYAPTVIGQSRSNYVPDPPNTENGKVTFSCPYCGTMLDSTEAQNRQSWKRHVFRDLRPYVCTFKDCQNSGKLYVSRHDWIYHELQIHRREFVCEECGKVCSSRIDMSTHLREHYDGSTPLAQLGVILDLCGRQIDVSDSRKDQCLICGEELSLSALYGHLAAHMEDIALFVLPDRDEEEENGGSEVSVQVAGPKCKDKRSNIESDASSLGFSVAGDHGQDSAEFARLLASEEAGYTSKFSSWRTTDEDPKSAVTTWTQGPSENDGRTELERQEFGDAEKTFEQRKEMLGRKHPDTLTSMHNLAVALQTQKKYGEAEVMYRQTIELREKVLGRKHPNTLASMNNLAFALQTQKKYGEAEVMYRQTIELREEVLGRKHPDTLISMHSLAVVLQSQGKYKEAEVIFRQIIELKEEVQGRKHPDTLTSMHNLAVALQTQKKHGEAEVMYLQTFELREEVLGRKHPGTLASMDNLAFVLLNQEKYGEAEVMYRQTIELREEVLGRKHPDTLISMHSLAVVLQSQGKYEEAEQMRGQILQLKEGDEAAIAVVKQLLATGESIPNSKDNEDGRTPLSYAAANGHEAIVELLLDTGKVDINSKDGLQPYGLDTSEMIESFIRCARASGA